MDLPALLEDREASLAAAAAAGAWSVRRLSGDRYCLRTSGAQVDVPAVDRAKMAVPCTISTQAVDRGHDVVVTAGIDLSLHRASPAVLCNHGLFDGMRLPIGKAEGPDGRYTGSLHDGFARAVTYFSQSLLEAEQVFALVEEGILRGVSIGFVIKSGEYRRDNPDDHKGPPGLLISSCEMFEYSHVSVPQNPQALADRIGKGTLCGRPVSRALLKSFLPHLPVSPEMVTGGWETPEKPPEGYASILGWDAVQKEITEIEARVKDPNITVDEYRALRGLGPHPTDGHKKVWEKSMTTSASEPAAPAAPPGHAAPGHAAPAPEPAPAPAPVTKAAGGMNETSGADGGYVPLDDAARDREETKDWPAGAHALRGCHDHLMALGQHIEDGFRRQENPAVREHMNALSDMAEVWAGKSMDCFKSEYPDIEPPDGSHKAMLPGDDGEDRPETRLPAAAARLAARAARVRRFLAEKFASWRPGAGAKAPLAAAAATLGEVAAHRGELTAAQRTAVAALAKSLGALGEQAPAGGERALALEADNGRLRAALTAALDNHEALKREFRKARRGR